MQGRPVSPAEKLLHDRIAQMGCVACRQDGKLNTWVSIHHVHGRTKPGAHMQVLPLCAGHHVGDGTDTISVHPWKKRFEERYGKQDDLVAAQWAELGVEYVMPERKAKPINREAKRKAPAAESKPTRQIQRAPRVKPETPEKVEKPAQVSKLAKPEITAKIAAPSRPLQSKGQKIPSAKKLSKTPQQIAFEADQKARQKQFRDERKPDIKAQAKEFRKARKAEYLEANQDQIAEQKQKAKEYRKQFMADLAERRKAS